MKKELLERFLRYTKVDTRSCEESTTTPSTPGQLNLAKILVAECEAMGLSDVSLDDNGYVMATLPSNTTDSVPTIGFIAHMDTSPDFNGKDVNAQIIHYTGGDILLNEALHLSLSPKDYPVLDTLIGEELITTDGTTLLGADDKAGIAEIMTAMAYLQSHPQIPHGTIKIAFTPDEEVGRGSDHFDVAKFGADFAYTIDGGELGELEAENFHAAGARVTIKGRNIHPGYAKDKMKNSITIATSYHQLLPATDCPECTSGYEGFYHLHTIGGDIEETTLDYIIRDFDKQAFESRKVFMQQCVDTINTAYGQGTASITIKDQYANMQEIIAQHPYIMTLAESALHNLEVPPKLVPIRGGTDGSRLSFMGLPCPNLFTGGHNFHGRFEFAVVSTMELATKVIVEIATLATTMDLK